MGTLGDLTGGFISGKDATDRWQANKQLRRGREQALEEGEMSLGGRRRVVDAVRQQTGAAPLPEFQSTFGDPFAKKILDWGRNLLGGQGDTPGAARELAAQKQQALPVDTPKRQTGGSAQPRLMANGGPVTSQVGQGQQVKSGGRFPGNQKLSGILFMADGGEVTWEDLQGRSSGEGRGFNMENFKEDVSEAGDWIKSAASEMVSFLSDKAPTMMAMAREGGADIRDSWQAASELGSEDMGKGALRTALDVPASVIRAGGATALGAGRDAAIAAGFGPEEQAAAGPAEQVSPIDTSALPQRIGQESATGTPPASSGGQQAPQQAVPMGGGPQQAADDPVQAIGPEQMPNMGVDEWADYRREVVTGLVEQGMNPEEAFRTVDDTVTGMQQRGFIRHLQEAQSLIAGGDKRGAIRALYSGFQYMPNGKDARFGIQNGQIVGLGIDEKTGERTKGAMVLDPESIGVMVENFSNPAAFRTWTMDWRKLAQDIKEYEETGKWLGQARAKALATSSQADLERARSGGSSDSYDWSDMNATDKLAAEEVGRRQMQGTLPEGLNPDTLRLAIARARARYPNTSVVDIADAVIRRYMETAGQ